MAGDGWEGPKLAHGAGPKEKALVLGAVQCERGHVLVLGSGIVWRGMLGG